ncbi:MAG: hypothetical protein CM15mP78_13360 [Candidatus Poseidoniales archaeon]|nr:MAG: hypothetical protein CM15mP78_13360 [Candidatus Poseidoniales archaeon]
MNNEDGVDVDTPRIIFVFLLTLSIVVILGGVFFFLSLLSAFSEFNPCEEGAYQSKELTAEDEKS